MFYLLARTKNNRLQNSYIADELSLETFKSHDEAIVNVSHITVSGKLRQMRLYASMGELPLPHDI